MAEATLDGAVLFLSFLAILLINSLPPSHSFRFSLRPTNLIIGQSRQLPAAKLQHPTDFAPPWSRSIEDHYGRTVPQQRILDGSA